MSQELLDGLERRLAGEPDNTFIKTRIRIIKERMGLSIKPRLPIPGPMVLDYLLSGRATATLQWDGEGEKGKRHVTFSIKQHFLKSGKRVVERLPKWDVWYRNKGQLYHYLYQLQRDNEGIKVHNFDNPPPELLAAAYRLNHVLEGSEVYSVFHDGTCGVCGADLTHPQSIQRGIGPKCYGEMTTEKRTEEC